MRIGVISDTHGKVQEEVIKQLQGVDYIFHAGDFTSEDVLETLEQIAPVYAVRGNNDCGTLIQDLPRMLKFSLGGVTFCMAHDRNDIPWELNGVDVIILGHSHIYGKEKFQGRLWLNPGSCSYTKSFRSIPTMMLLELDEEGVVEVFPVELPR